jgi:DNA-binding LacI/PurR family transcriptional regulator
MMSDMALNDTQSARPPRLADVAKMAGVAISTASRALSQPDRVNRMTREKVEAAAEELSYVPNAQARALSSGRTRTIAVIVADVANPFYFDIIKGTAEAARASGYSQLLMNTGESRELEDDLLIHFQNSFDGVVLAAPRLPDARLTALATTIPLVAINRRSRGVANVVIDTPSGCAQAVEHLVSLGHRRIAYMSGPDSSWSSEARWRALKRATDSHGIEVLRIGPFLPTKESGAAAADALLNTPATAAVAFNDLIAIGMLMRLSERGVNVPGEISIVGCDDIFGADFCNPPLTTLAAPIAQAGRTAVAMLLRLIEFPLHTSPPTTALLPTQLTVRASTGPAPRSERLP